MSSTNKIIKYLLIFICIVQIVQSSLTIKYDIKEITDAGEDTANFLKEENIEGKKVYGIGYDVESILPYFDKNIFDNLNKDKKSIWLWKDENGYMTDKEMLEEQADYYVFSVLYFQEHKVLSVLLKEYGFKPIMILDGNLYTKSFIHDTKAFIVYKKFEMPQTNEE